MKNTIKISKPYIKDSTSDLLGETVKLCAEIIMKNPNTNIVEKKECYFEFEARYKEYLCPERSDAFVMGLLSCAMETNMDIEFELPISEQLYYQLTTYYIPMVAANNPNYPMHNIKLIGPCDNHRIENKGAVVTGCSGGVDSFYTIARHSKDKVSKQHQLTHLVYSSMGTLDNVESRMKDVFKKTLSEIQKIAKECDLDTIACYSNLHEFYYFPYEAFVTFFSTVYGSIGYALQKLINIYYESSGGPISHFNLDISKTHGYDSSVFDVFTLSCMNTENLHFYSTGVECSRMEKEKYIADYKPAQKYLAVCTVHALYENPNELSQNCSVCYKCLRTMAHFYSFGKLQNFKKVFNVDEFMKHKTKWIGKMFGQDISNYVHEMKESAKKNNVKIPLGSYFYAYFWYKPIKILRKTFKKSLFARKIYYKFNLDYKLDGYRGPAYETYQQKIKEKESK